MSTDVDNFIAHFGIKGMKWGVHNAENSQPRIRTQAELDKRARNIQIAKKIAIGTAVVAAIGITAYGGKQIYNYKQETNALAKRASTGFSGEILERYGKDKGETFQRGYQFLRRSTNPETHITDRAFVTAKEVDAAGYSGFGGWQMKITAVKDVVTPSTKERVDAMISTISDKEIASRVKTKANLGAKVAARFADKKQLAAIKLDKITFDEWKTDEAKAFMSTLKSKGYSAVWDDWDKGSSHIIFDDAAFKYAIPQKTY